jgi:hypothetical protein
MEVRFVGLMSRLFQLDEAERLDDDDIARTLRTGKNEKNRHRGDFLPSL